MIGRIVIENYKSIENLTLDLGRVTVLIGANGSGKSNILEAVALCSAAAANKLDNEFLFARGIRVSEDARHMRAAFDRTNVDKPIKVAASIDSNNALFEMSSYQCELIPEGPKGDSYAEWENLTTQTDAKLLMEDYISKNMLQLPNTNFNLILDFNKQAVIGKGMIFSYAVGLTHFLIYSSEYSALRRFEEEGQIRPLGIRGEGLFKLLTVLARETEPEEGKDKTRLAEIQERLGLLDWFGDFQIGGNTALGERTLKIRDQYLDGDLAYFTQRSANEGFLFLLFYFTLFVAKETPRFFAIDNIDASLNPKLCAELLRQLTELAEKYDKQVILTTHNPAVLDGLNLRDDNQRLYVVERDLDGRTGARRVPAPRPPEKHEEETPLSEAFLRGYIGGLPKNF